MKLGAPETSAIAKTWETLMTWLNPARRERATFIRCIEAGEELLKVLRAQGRYKNMPEDRRKKWETHYQKQWDAWKDGHG